jgi:hypothetical protein
MYQIVRSEGLLRTVRREGVPAVASLLVTDLCLKLHSFALELAAFLAMWYGFSWIWSRARSARLFNSASPSTRAGAGERSARDDEVWRK